MTSRIRLLAGTLAAFASIFGLCGLAIADPAVVGAQSTSTFICPAHPCVALPVTLSRTTSEPVLGYSVTIQLSPNLTLCSGTSSITEGPFLSSAGGTIFFVTDNGGGSYTVDDVVHGATCGPTGSGTLFNVGVTSSDAGGSGSISVTAVELRDCSNASLPVVPGAPGTVPIDTQAPAITVTSPNGGEDWIVGTSHAITWTASDNTGIGSIDLAYSTDGGATFPNVIATGLPNTGSYAWTVPNTPTTQARVRATAHDVACSSASDASDANFTIRNQVTTSTSLDVQPPTSVCGQKVTLTATVTPAGGTGTVTFFDGANALGSAPVDASGHATLSVTTLALGSHSLTAVYSGDGVYLGSTSPAVSHVVNKAPATVLVTSAPNPSTYGDKVTFTVTVTPTGATGSVTLRDSVMVLGTAPLDASGHATFSVATLRAGAHTDVTATYSGDGCYATAMSAPLTQQVNRVASVTTLTQDSGKTFFGGNVTLTAQVGPNEPGGNPSGHVYFYDGPNQIGSANVQSNGTATLHVSNLTVGKHDLSAVYQGDNNFIPSTSNTVSHEVNPVATTTTLMSDANPAKQGSIVQLLAHVDPAGATGTVEFFDGATSLGTAPVDGSGNAGLAVSTLAPGKHDLTASYSGDAFHAASASAPYSQVIVGGPTAHVEFPNGGEFFKIGTSIKIVWSSSGPQSIPTASIYVSRDYGATYDPIAVDIANTGSYVWSVTGPGNNTNGTPVYSSLIKVVVKDVSGLTGEDTSDAPFAIHDPGFTGVGGAPPVAFGLTAPSPNPATRALSVEFAVATPAHAHVGLIDVQGREVAVLADGVYAPGRYHAAWDAAVHGRLAAGLYFVRYQAAGRTFTMRAVIAH